jgi:transcriptional regulator with XRE-family HTH domain
MAWNTERLFLLAKARGWSDAELARRMGVAQSTVSRVHRGEIQPGERFYQGVCIAFPAEDVTKLMWRDGHRPTERAS